MQDSKHSIGWLLSIYWILPIVGSDTTSADTNTRCRPPVCRRASLSRYSKGGNYMSRFTAFAALVAIAACSGCQMMGRGYSTGEPSHITRSNMAPRPNILRTMQHPVAPCGTGGSYCDSGCGFGGGCCDAGCGCEEGYGCDCGAGCGGEVGCCDTCGGSGVCGGCGGGGCNSCGGSGGCCLCSGGPMWCGLCNRFSQCDGCGACEQGFVTGCVEGVCSSCASGDQNYGFNPGPPAPQTAYPYYTVRGPRDFLQSNPASIGPY